MLKLTTFTLLILITTLSFADTWAYTCHTDFAINNQSSYTAIQTASKTENINGTQNDGYVDHWSSLPKKLLPHSRSATTRLTFNYHDTVGTLGYAVVEYSFVCPHNQPETIEIYLNTMTKYDRFVYAYANMPIGTYGTGRCVNYHADHTTWSWYSDKAYGSPLNVVKFCDAGKADHNCN